MAKPTFSRLWALYPRTNSPCTGSWANQCAIRMSLCLNSEGTVIVSSETYTDPKCSHGHARGAESLANWLWKKHLRAPRIYTDGATAKTKHKDDTGIMFFKNCFTRGGETRAAGDHIDLWNKGSTKGFQDGENNSEEVWFWKL